MAAKTDWATGDDVNATDLNNLGTEVNLKAAAVDVTAGLAGKQATDADLTAIAALTPANDDVLQRKAGAWANRTIAQLKSDLGITGSNTGDQDLSGYATTSAVATGYQPLDADLTALAALTTPATKLSGIATGADVTSATNVGSAIHGATAKTAPVTADEVALIDSAASNVLKRITYGDLSTAIVALITASAPSTLDTLQELATALGNDPNFAASMATALGLKAPLASPAFTGTPTGITKTHVGLGSVDNTSNAAERAAVRTLTNARITPRVNSATSNATPALDATYDATILTAQAAAITAFSLTNTFTAEQKHMLRILDNGTARAITWTSTVIVPADGITLPTTTVVGKTHRIGLIYNEVIGKLVAWAVGTV